MLQFLREDAGATFGREVEEGQAFGGGTAKYGGVAGTGAEEADETAVVGGAGEEGYG